MIVWELRLFDPDTGARVATFDMAPEFGAELKVNDCGTYALRLAGDDARVALFAADAILELWWCDKEAGIDWRREFSAWVLDPEFWTDENDAEHLLSSGRTLEDLLARTIIDTYSGSADSEASGPGEAALKKFVDEQLCTGARARPGLSVEADAGLGLTWNGQRSNKYVLGVCQDIAEATGLQFGIERTGAYTFAFRVWEPTDRRATVIFSTDRGNMATPRLKIKRSQVKNWIKVGGDGVGAARDFTYVEDAASQAESPQGRREAFVQASDQAGENARIAKGAAELAKNRKTTDFTFTALQTPGCRYGLHYFLGDLVTALYRGASYSMRVDSVSWTIDADGAQIGIGMVEAVTDDGS